MPTDTKFDSRLCYFPDAGPDQHPAPARRQRQAVHAVHRQDQRAVVDHRHRPGDQRALPGDDGNDKAGQAMGKKGSAARAASMTPERRAEIAKKATAKRWRGSKHI